VKSHLLTEAVAVGDLLCLGALYKLARHLTLHFVCMTARRW